MPHEVPFSSVGRGLPQVLTRAERARRCGGVSIPLLLAGMIVTLTICLWMVHDATGWAPIPASWLDVPATEAREVWA